MRRKTRDIAAIFIMVLLIFMVGCATLTQKRVTLGLADWYVTNHTMLKAEMVTATEEHKEFLMKKVLPYMDLMKYGVVGMDAVDEKNIENMAFAARGLLRHGAKFDYDPTTLIAAIKAEDYDTIQAELLVLKNLIIVKWVKIQ